MSVSWYCKSDQSELSFFFAKGFHKIRKQSSRIQYRVGSSIVAYSSRVSWSKMFFVTVTRYSEMFWTCDSSMLWITFWRYSLYFNISTFRFVVTLQMIPPDHMMICCLVTSWKLGCRNRYGQRVGILRLPNLEARKGQQKSLLSNVIKILSNSFTDDRMIKNYLLDSLGIT